MEKKKKKKSVLQNVLPPACWNEKMTTLWEVLAYPVREALDALTGQNSISSLSLSTKSFREGTINSRNLKSGMEGF